MNRKRCAWVSNDPLYQEYHDTEWGVPVRDDEKQFEFLLLETFQAGLSWLTILRKRENFRQAFDGFDYHKIAGYGEPKIGELMQDAGIIRNEAKIRAAVNNAQKYMQLQKEFGSFTAYIWHFSSGEVVNAAHKHVHDVPATSELSDRISADLRRRGCKFTGSTVIYAHLQATGIINDHTTDCFRHDEVKGL